MFKRNFVFLAFVLLLSVSLIAEEIAIPLNMKSKFVGDVNLDKMILEQERGAVSLYFTVEEEWLYAFNKEKLESMNRLFIHLINENKILFSSIKFMVKGKNENNYFNITSILHQSEAVPKKEDQYEKSKVKSFRKSVRKNEREGFLKDKTIFVSAGHGWTNDTSSWVTQRLNTSSYNLVEDLSNAEIVDYYLIPYLKNAGALIFTVREHDTNSNMVIVDNSDFDSNEANGVYEESGSWIDTDGGKGFGQGSTPYAEGVNPFELGDYRYISGTVGAKAFWIPNIPEKGLYEVYVSFKSGTDRAANAEYIVHHAGGSTSVFADQRHHGSTWYNLGKFPFYKGLDRSTGSVELVAESDSAEIFIADAVRFGGGVGIMDHGIGLSGKPRWEEFARHNIQFMGAPATGVYDGSGTERSDDVRARSRYAAWENEADYDDSLYISWHSNGWIGTSRGISTYIYGENGPGSGYEPAAADGSEALGSYVHNSILETLRNGYDSEFKVYGIGLYSAYLGEIDPDENSEMPSVLVELAFHDNDEDAAMLREPLMRRLSARGAYHGIVKYFADRDNISPVFLPDNVTALRTEVSSLGAISLFWEVPAVGDRIVNGDLPAGYIVQKSKDGFGFDDGEDVGNRTYWNFTPENSSETWYFRVIAYNDGGKSFPSPVVAAKADSTVSKALIVDSFTKLDSDMEIMQPFPDETSSDLTPRMFLEKMNSYDYVKEYGLAIDNLIPSFESMTVSMFDDVDLSDYDIVIWFSGVDNSLEDIFLGKIDKIKSYLENGGVLILTGSDIAAKLVFDEESSFLTSYLGSSFVSDIDNYLFELTPDFGVLDFEMEDLSSFNNSGKNDLLETEGGTAFIIYSDGSNAAVIQKSFYKTALMGFPFERVKDADVKSEIMKTILDYEDISYDDNDVVSDTDYLEDDEDIVDEDISYNDNNNDDNDIVSDADSLDDDEEIVDEEIVDEDNVKNYICTYNNVQYEAGDTFPKNDECGNECYCNKNGEVSCTDRCNENGEDNSDRGGCGCNLVI